MLVNVVHQRCAWNQFNALCAHISIAAIAAAAFDAARSMVQRIPDFTDRFKADMGFTDADCALSLKNMSKLPQFTIVDMT